LLAAVFSFFTMSFPVTLAAFSHSVLHGGASGFALLTSLLAAGSVVGSLLAARNTRFRLRGFVALATALSITQLLAAVAPGRPALFAVLIPVFLLLLAPTEWNSSEEDYFQLAYRQVAPEAFSEHHAIFDSAQARIAAELFMGNSVKWFGYETAHVVLRVFLALLYAASFALFFSAIQISAIESILIIAVFCAMGEQLVGGELLFHGVEPKTFAYAFIVFAFGMAYRGRWLATFCFAAAATYMHFLVGGFWTLILLVIQYREQQDLKGLGVSAGLFTVLVLPLIVVVVPHDLVSLMAPAPADGPSADFIYSELRGAEHMGPFKSRWAFWLWLPGLVTTLSLLAVLAGLRRRKLLVPIGFVAMIGLGYLLLAVGVAFFDRHANYLGKFYMFRPSSLTLLLTITAIVLSIRRACSENARGALVLVSTAFIAAFLWNAAKLQVDIVRSTPAIPYESELVAAIEKNSAPNDIVLIEPFNEMHNQFVHLHRAIPRPTLVSWKFAPTYPSDVLLWYDLIRRRERYFEQGCAEPMQPRVKLLVIFQKDVAERMRGCGERVWEKEGTVLIAVRDSETLPAR
jgi:hypothetical protein